MFQSRILAGHLKCGLLCAAVVGRIVAPKGSHVLIPRTVNLLGGRGELRVACGRVTPLGYPGGPV